MIHSVDPSRVHWALLIRHTADRAERLHQRPSRHDVTTGPIRRLVRSITFTVDKGTAPLFALQSVSIKPVRLVSSSSNVNMVAYSAVKASNALIKSSLPSSPTALFVGSTAGIGQVTMRGFAASFENPTIYFVGRSKSKGDAIIEELKQINAMGRYEFLVCDFTLLHEIDQMSKTVEEKVVSSGLDYICLSPGFLDFSGRNGKPTIPLPSSPIADTPQKRQKV